MWQRLRSHKHWVLLATAIIVVIIVPLLVWVKVPGISTFVVTHRLGELAAILGVAGIIFTIYQVVRSQSVIEHTAKAVEHVRKEITHGRALAEISDSRGDMEELITLLKDNALIALSGRCRKVRQSIVAIRAKPAVLAQHQSKLQDITLTLRQLEERATKSQAKGKSFTPETIAEFSMAISDHTESLTAILSYLQDQSTNEEVVP